eukprot:697041_1
MAYVNIDDQKRDGVPSAPLFEAEEELKAEMIFTSPTTNTVAAPYMPLRRKEIGKHSSAVDHAPVGELRDCAICGTIICVIVLIAVTCLSIPLSMIMTGVQVTDVLAKYNTEDIKQLCNTGYNEWSLQFIAEYYDWIGAIALIIVFGLAGCYAYCVWCGGVSPYQKQRMKEHLRKSIVIGVIVGVILLVSGGIGMYQYTEIRNKCDRSSAFYSDTVDDALSSFIIIYSIFLVEVSIFVCIASIACVCLIYHYSISILN